MKKYHIFLLTSFLIILSATLACSGSGDIADSGITKKDSGTRDGGNHQEVPDTNCPAGKWVSKILGKVVFEDGKAAADALVSPCVFTNGSDALLCLQPMKIVDKNTGAFSYEVPSSSRCLSRIITRIFIPSVDFATSYRFLEIENIGETYALNVEKDFILYSTDKATEIPDFGDKTEEREVVFSNGLKVDVTPVNYGGESEEAYLSMAARTLNPMADKVYLPAEYAVDFIEVIALSQEKVIRETAFSFRLPNQFQLVAGAKVELFVQGGLLECHLNDSDKTKVHEGEWAKFGEATVSANGSEIVADKANGLPCWNWFAYKLKAS